METPVSLTLDLSRAKSAAAPANLSGLTRPQLAAALVEAGVAEPKKARMRASQLWRWIHHYGVSDFDLMTDIGKDARKALADPCCAGLLPLGAPMPPHAAALGLAPQARVDRWRRLAVDELVGVEVDQHRHQVRRRIGAQRARGRPRRGTAGPARRVLRQPAGSRPRPDGPEHLPNWKLDDFRI